MHHQQNIHQRPPPIAPPGQGLASSPAAHQPPQIDFDVSLHASPMLHSASAARPQSDRADDVLPKGTVFRWNPYASTPTNTSFGQHAVVGSRVTPRSPAQYGTNTPLVAGGRQASSSSFLSAPASTSHGPGYTSGAPFCIISPRAETAAAHGLATTPLADDVERHEAAGGAADGLSASEGQRAPSSAAGGRSPLSGGFVGVTVASHDPETGEPLPPRVFQVTADFSLSTDSRVGVERTLAALVEEPRDSAVRERVLALSQSDANQVYAYLVRHLDVVDWLCTRHRGKIVADAIEAAAESLSNHELYRWVIANIQRLSVDQSGCIAVTRVYDAVGTTLRALVDDFVAMQFVDLSGDAYGNYVVQRVIAAGNAPIIDSMGRQLRSRGVAAALTTSKPGSHVVERFVTRAPLAVTLPVCRQLLLGEVDSLKALADHRYGNYVLQACLKRVFASCKRDGGHQQQQKNSGSSPSNAAGAGVTAAATETPDQATLDAAAALARECEEIIPPIVAQSSNAANINRAMGIRVSQAGGSGGSAAQQQQQQHASPIAAAIGSSRPAVSRGVDGGGSSSGSPSAAAVGTGKPRLSAAALRKGGGGLPSTSRR